jgi:hemerythrin-like metal-binding protein
MKRFLEWRDSWCLGCPRIDRQHIDLAQALNQAFEVVAAAPDPQAAQRESQRLLQALLEQTRQHFDDEEVLMDLCNFPELGPHRREHAMLLAELREFMREIEAGSGVLDVGSLTSLKHWLIDHVLDADKAFVDHLKAHCHRMCERIPEASTGRRSGACESARNRRSQRPGD